MTDRDVIEAVVERTRGSHLFDGWEIAQSTTWSSYRPLGSDGPDDGFKIHVAASISSAAAILDAVLPLIAAARIPFKHAATMEQLAMLASGRLGLTQIGKFLTVYPSSVDGARELAGRLHDATRELVGPQIVDDIPVTAGSLVHFRYGAYIERWLQMPTGRLTPARLGSTGLEPDDRYEPAALAPETITPYDRLDVPDGSPGRVVGGRYVRAQQLYAGPKGSTWVGFALDRPDEELLVIKEARAFVMEATDGSDACARLAHEAQMLRLLAGSRHTPTFVDYWDEPKRSYLVYRLVEGPTLSDVIKVLGEECPRPPTTVLQEWTRKLCDAVASVHDAGLVMGDIKPANLIVTNDGFQFVDLELAGPPTGSPTPGIGTAGYSSPQQSHPGRGRGFCDDIYATGATLLAAALLVDASVLPDTATAARFELDRDPTNPVLAAVVRCVEPEEDRAFDSVRQIYPAVLTDIPSLPRPPREPLDYLALARVVGDDLLTRAIVNDDGAYWISAHPVVQDQPGRDLYAGSSGIALFLTTLYRATGDRRYLDRARECAEWLWNTPASYQQQIAMPGLYFGDCGPGLLYLALFLATGERRMADRALNVAARVQDLAPHSPDLLTGDAGTALFLLCLARGTGDGALVGAVADRIDRLVSEIDGPGFSWTIPAGHDGLSGQSYLGFSHGTAGIGYLIAQYALVADDASARELVAQIAAWLIGTASPGPLDARGLDWPVSIGPESPTVTYWCHGAGGVARFLQSAYEATGDEAIGDAVRRASYTVAAGSWWSGTTQCHGLAGNAEALIDTWQCVGGEQWLRAAHALGENLVAYRGENGWPTEDRNLWAPDLLVGQAGVGGALIRLASPETSHIVSPAAFDRQLPITAVGPQSGAI